MARKSRWAQFTDNFNGVYGTFNQVGKDMASGKVMREEYTDEEGNALSGDALDRRRTMELAKVYTKYGDAKGGLALRSQQAQIEASKRENDINQNIMQELIRQRGGLTSKGMESDIANTDAGTADTRSLTESRDALLPGQITQQAATLASTNANTNDTTSGMNRRDALLPGEITQQAATLASTNAGTADTTSVMNRRDALLPGEVSQQGATLSDTIAGTESTIAGTTGQGIANRVAEETSDSEIDAAIAGNEANAAESKFKKLENTLAFEDLDREESILTDVMSDDSYNTPEEVQEAYITAIMNDDTIPFERRNQIIASVNKNSLEKLTNESAKLAKGAQTALQKGGMSGLVEYYDTIDDGDTMRIERKDGTVSIIATRGDEETVLFSDSSQDAETIVTQQMYNQISRPGTGMEVAAAALDMEKTRSETSKNQSQVGLIDKQAFSELLEQGGTEARTALLNAQTDKVRAEIEQLGVGLQGAEKINLQGLADLQNSSEFVLLGQQKGGKKTQLSLVADYMRVMKMKDAPPNDVDPQDWFEATDEEKEALRN
jgi:hypothetical protein